MKTVATVIVFLRNKDDILLAMKKRGFGKGLYNGAGGKIEDGESAKDCAIRETFEEIEVKVHSLTQVADLTFHEQHLGAPHHVHSAVFFATEWEGDPVETDEMAPQWFALSDIPYDEMWGDDKYWLPQVINGEKVVGEFWFDENNMVVRHSIKNMEEFHD